MSSVTLTGSAPPELAETLTQAGMELGPDADLVLVWYDDKTARAELKRRSRQDELVVAMVTDAEDVDAAIEAGAVDAIVGLPPPATLRARLMAIVRINRAWRRRLRTHERRARKALAELTSTRDLLGRLIDATPNPVMAADTRGRVLVFNRAAESALGYDSTWARDQLHVTDIYTDPSHARRVLAEIRSSPTGIVHELDVRLRGRTGEQIPVLLSAAEVYAADGMPMATVGVFQDQRAEISLRKRLADATEQLIDTEKRAAAMEVAGAASHELNQPLTAVMGSLELLTMRDDLPEDVVNRLNRAYGQLERMARIVRALARTTRPRTVRYLDQTQILDLSTESE